MRAPLDLCCMLWARTGEAADLHADEDAVLALVDGHGGAVRSRAIGEGSDGRPDEVQLFRFPDRAALDGYLSDPCRLTLSSDRDRTVVRTELFPVSVRRDGVVREDHPIGDAPGT